MKSKINIKTKLGSIVLTVAIFCLSLTGLFFFQKSSIDSYAATSASKVDIPNGNFTSTSGDYPSSPNNFTASQSVDNAGVKAGVINLDHEDYKDLYSKNANAESNDPYVLMIESENQNANFSYTTSNPITLDAASHYQLTVDVYTTTNNGSANLFLFDGEEEFSAINNINSMNKWTTYNFFVSTNDVESLDLKIRLNLKNTGVVLFDSLSCYKLSEDELRSRMSTITSDAYKRYIDEREQNLIKVVNLSSDIFTGSVGTGYTTHTTHVKSELDGSADSAFVIENTTATKSKFETTDDFITVKQNEIIKVSLNVKVENITGNVNLQLLQTNLGEDEEAVNSDAINITSKTGASGNLMNDYATYSFYIFGYPNKTVTYKLAVGLGNDSTDTKAKVYLTTATFTKVNYSTFNSVSTGTTAQKINLNDKTKADTSIYLDNGNFNTFKIDDYNKPFPATPESWEVKTGSGIQKYGVVNTAEFDKLADLGLSNLSNPLSPSGAGVSDSVLMMYNAGADSLTYTSASKNLSAKTYHKFSIQAQTQGSPILLELVGKKDNADVVLASTSIETTIREWKTVEMYVYSGFQAWDISLRATLKSDKCAYAYLDNTMFDYSAQPTETEFNTLLTSESVVKADLSNMFAGGNGNWATPLFFSAADVDNVKYGTINLNNSDLKQEVVQNEENLQKFTALNSNNKNVIGIRSMADTNFTLTSNLGYKLTSGTTYKISVYAFTQGLQSVTGDNKERGASIKLTSFEDAFTRVESEGDWTKYTFYVKPNNDVTTYIQFSIGNSTAACSGDAFFGGIEFEELDSSANIDDITANKYTLVLKETAENTENDDDSNENEENANNNNGGNSSALWYAIPTILTGLAILIAIVGILMRKVKWKKPRKKAKNQYDRTATVSKQIYERKATTLREEKLRELGKQLDKKSAERVAFEEQYKKDLSTMRQLKIKRADQSEINKLSKDMKKNQKLSANLGLEITRLESDIELMKTDAYFNSLVKKLMREAEANRNNQVEEETEKPVENKKKKGK